MVRLDVKQHDDFIVQDQVMQMEIFPRPYLCPVDRAYCLLGNHAQIVEENQQNVKTFTAQEVRFVSSS